MCLSPGAVVLYSVHKKKVPECTEIIIYPSGNGLLSGGPTWPTMETDISIQKYLPNDIVLLKPYNTSSFVPDPPLPTQTKKLCTCV